MKWQSAKIPPSEQDAFYTLVKVKGWTRYGFAVYVRKGKSSYWNLYIDPALEDFRKEVEEATITHWLKLPNI